MPTLGPAAATPDLPCSDKPTNRKRKSSDLPVAESSSGVASSKANQSADQQPPGPDSKRHRSAPSSAASDKSQQEGATPPLTREDTSSPSDSSGSRGHQQGQSPQKERLPTSSSSSSSPSSTSPPALEKYHSYASQSTRTGSSDSNMGNCVGKKSTPTRPTGNDRAVIEALTHSPKRTTSSPAGSFAEAISPPPPPSEQDREAAATGQGELPSKKPPGLKPDQAKHSPVGKHGSRRRLSLIHADPITHITDEGPRGTAQILHRRSAEQRLPLENVLSTDGVGTRVSVMGAAAHTLQKNFEDKNETCKGNVTGETLITLGIGHACRKGLKPESPNQDDFFIIRIEDIGLYGVFDGHGPFGHDISNFVQQNLPKLIYNHAEFYTNPQSCLLAAFRKVQEEIEKSCEKREFDAALSGCTATVIIHDIEKGRLYVAHVGDSRAVLAQRGGADTQFTAVDLTQDHKPTMEQERTRIESKGGEVKRLEGDIPFRVFLKDKMYPGLAMSRALGDLVATQAGVSSEPEISVWEIDQDRDVFIVLCSDGVWEFISSQESVELVAKHGRRSVQVAADTLARESWNKWIVEEGDVVDDITVEVIYLS
eukprot:Protomagalhaensia_sp_Gyna_25__6093@NODE_97_length_5296_cov_22_579037_g74_i0_p1_GENE_NODE_97_length_5296_cov_22_579037_g74_i0NODE_97_length_5296_cov_22_579037_g74_i0_p1_ORF_typecomplete_len596_score114_25PP2C/PF00481_21/9_4e62PP2C_2/PF13672_6/5_4e21SpoIIE/PF07228_12/5_1e13_NODE_97_length_5296_cov_22_579037_g74_i015383325